MRTLGTGEPEGGANGMGMPSAFKYFIGGVALFIAGCSAYFSVQGLGLLFIGSMVAVMVMAASLEAGKLVAASFLYRYWNHISRPLRFYLTLAVLLLIGITSLGNYGYLARAYEKTHSKIGLFEAQIADIEREIADTQARIDASRGQLGKADDAGRQDVVKQQERIVAADASLEQALARLQERRKLAQDQRDRDLETISQRLTQQTDVLKKSIAAEEASMATLTERLGVLDRAVDAYTKQGGPGFFKADSIRKGQDLLEEQKPERTTIAARMNEHRTRLDELRTEHAKLVAAAETEVAGVREQFSKVVTVLEAEEPAARKMRDDAVAQAETSLAALKSQGQQVADAGGTQIAALYQQMRTGQESIRQLREKIAATDIGSYRFVARAFSASADSVVKWLILALVLVFDPLAVVLTVGFNVALMAEGGRRSRTSLPAVATTATATVSGGRWVAVGSTVAGIALIAGIVAGITHFTGKSRVTEHARLVPADSFAVVTLQPAALQRASKGESLADWLGGASGKSLAAAMGELMGNGFDPRADVYAFAKYPAGKHDGTQPVMLCGLVARVTNQSAAEAALSRVAERWNNSLQKTNGAVPTRNRSMVRYGQGRYLEPEGGFFSFALTENAAIVMLEIEGDPKVPRIENEIRLCLATPVEGPTADKLPARALARRGPITLWMDAARFSASLPKTAATQTRYQQLQRHLGFDLVLEIQPTPDGKLNLVADYAYTNDRFARQGDPSAVQVLAQLGTSPEADLAGRLMDRCADTLDYDSLIERLRTSLAGSDAKSAQEVLVEKSIASPRQATFVLTARYDEHAGPPLFAMLHTVFP